jgi:hypothetical protein
MEAEKAMDPSDLMKDWTHLPWKRPFSSTISILNQLLSWNMQSTAI